MSIKKRFAAGAGRWISSAGQHVSRYGLVLIIGWIGAMKFTAVEAEAIRPLVENSPLMSWAYVVVGVRAFSAILGVVELAVAFLIAIRPISPSLSALGSAMATMMFATTLSFLITTPQAWITELGGFPAPSDTGQFLLKDIGLLGISLWTLGEALSASVRPSAPPQ